MSDKSFLERVKEIRANMVFVLVVMLCFYLLSIVSIYWFFELLGIEKSSISLSELIYFLLCTFVIASLIYYRGEIGKLMPRIKRIGNVFEIEPEFGEDKYGKPTGSLRDAFLVYAMHLFRVENYIDAYYHYNMAHQKEKSVLSSYMLLSCLLKLSASAELIRDVYDDALIVAEESKDLKGHKYSIQKFISGESLKENRGRLALEAFVTELRKEVNQFEIDTLSWFSVKDTSRMERGRTS